LRLNRESLSTRVLYLILAQVWLMSADTPSLPALPTEAQLKTLAIFPLANVCLFPNTSLPLHIFEPRYREMVRQAIADSAPIAIATIDAATAQSPRPSVYPVAGIGTIAHHERLPDGRFQLVLQGVARVRLGRELAVETPWRQVEATLLQDLVIDDRAVAEHAAALRGILRSLALTHPQVGPVFARFAAQNDSPAILADRVADTLIRDSDSRLQLLTELRVDQRLERVLERAGELLARFAGMKASTARN
jgi:Lon protease-like protein